MIVYARYNSQRRPQFRVGTYFHSSDAKHVEWVEKRALAAEARPFVQKLLRTYSELHQQKLPVQIAQATFLDESAVRVQFVPGMTRAFGWTQLLQAGKREQILDEVRTFRSLLREFADPKSGKIISGLLDLNLDNFIVDPHGQSWLIDYEWTAEQPATPEFVLFRAIVGWYGSHRNWLPWKVVTLKEMLDVAGVLDEVEAFALLEDQFQNQVTEARGTMIEAIQGLFDEAESQAHFVRDIDFEEQVEFIRQESEARAVRLAMLEREMTNKDKWIKHIETVAENKDRWIEKLEKDIAELKSDLAKLSDP